MKIYVKRFSAAVLLTGLLITGGCGGSDVFVPVVTTVTDIYPPTPATTPPNYANAAGADYTYHLTSVTTDYTYTIDNFAKGDKLVLPAGAAPLLVNSNPADGSVSLSAVTTGGGKFTVLLNKLTPAQDGALSKVSDLNTVFGDGTVTTVSVNPNTIIVGTGGSVDASLGDYVYDLQPSTTDYTYSVANFATGDKLVFPAGGGLLSVDNTNFTDGKAKIISLSALNGVITVELTNLTPEQDSKIISVNSINTLFGAGTVTQK